MANSRKAHLDALEDQLNGPRRIGLFGHRDVGKTTLLAVFYRQASSGQIPGLRLAAGDPASAEYLAEKVAQIESGEPPAGTLAETELRLRLYHDHGTARFELIVKDYQGEHITLGSDEPIQQFFADCDAVFLCLDPEGSPSPLERRKRQQEVENLFERYLDGSRDGTIGRPVAVLLTKFDRVLGRTPAQPGTGDEATPAAGEVDRLLESEYGMTRHALAEHAPRGAIFAVSAYGRGASGGRPPAELHPLGLERPLEWLVEQLEAGDREALEWLWDLAPDDLPRLSRCVAAFERRYPRSEVAAAFRDRLKTLRRRRRRRSASRVVGIAVVLAAGLAGWDFWGYRTALAFERDHPAPAVAEHWARLVDGHPSLDWFWPASARRARQKQAEWTVKAAALQVVNGTAAPDLEGRLVRLKDEAPELIPEIRKVEVAREERRHEARWNAVRALALAPTDEPDKPLAEVQGFLREFPDTTHRGEALAMAETLRSQAVARQSALERQIVDDLIRSEGLPGTDDRDLIERARQFLADHPKSAWRVDVEHRFEGYVRRVDDRDIERARQYSRQYPSHFAARVERYHEYLKTHQTGGRFISEATEAKDQVLREWDTYTYRLAYDHLTAHPDDVAEVARRLREYLRVHPDGRYTRVAEAYLDWWDKVSVPGDYRVTLRRGTVDPGVGKYLGGGGPDLGVILEVGGALYGPSPVVRNTARPIWDYTFPRPIRWKLGDPVTVRIIDYDWSDSTVAVLNSRKGDPLAIRNLAGTIKLAQGGETTLVFASDFTMPKLTRPEK